MVFIICGKEQRGKRKVKVETKNLNHICLFLDLSEILFFLVGRAGILIVYLLRFVIVMLYTTEKQKLSLNTLLKVQLNENIALKVQWIRGVGEIAGQIWGLSLSTVPF